MTFHDQNIIFYKPCFECGWCFPHHDVQYYLLFRFLSRIISPPHLTSQHSSSTLTLFIVTFSGLNSEVFAVDYSFIHIHARYHYQPHHRRTFSRRKSSLDLGTVSKDHSLRAVDSDIFVRTRNQLLSRNERRPPCTPKTSGEYSDC
jgi:hypothetical protein